MFKSRQFLIFLITGGIAAIANFSSRFIFSLYYSFSLSVIFAYLIGMITAFLLAKFFVFKKSINSTKKELSYFILVNAIAVIQTYIISIGFAFYIFPKMTFNFYPETIAHGIGIIFPVFSSFIGHKKLSFKS